MNAPWNNEDLRRAFDADFDALVAFASRSKARVGYAFLRADGQVDLGRPLDARISARMTHVFALAQMRGIEGTSHLVSHGLAALTGPLRAANGSWYSEVVPTSETSAIPVPRSVLSQRAQAAMIGAAAAALMAGTPRPPTSSRTSRRTKSGAGGTPPTVPCAKKSTRPPRCARPCDASPPTSTPPSPTWPPGKPPRTACGSTVPAPSCASSGKSPPARASPCPTSSRGMAPPAPDL